jgi:D-sedoheptulose 7-phosphate isomerase
MADTASDRDFIRQHLETGAAVRRAAIAACTPAITAAAELLIASFQSGGKLLLCGNGGSAADCQHIAAEFVSALNHDRPRAALGAIALTTDTSFLTANANDFGFEQVFERQVEALGRRGDVLIGITTSGNSANVLRALARAKHDGLGTIVLTGESGGKAAPLADVALKVPSGDTQHIQETHIAVGHILCALVERALFG